MKQIVYNVMGTGSYGPFCSIYKKYYYYLCVCMNELKFQKCCYNFNYYLHVNSSIAIIKRCRFLYTIYSVIKYIYLYIYKTKK